MTSRTRVRRAKRMLVPVVAVGTISAGMLGVTATAAHATTDYGYGCAMWTNISLFGGPYGTEGCGTQTSPYATANSAAPEKNWVYATPGNVTDNNGAQAVYGPAVFVSSPYDINDNLTNTGQLRVSTSGSTNVNVQSRAIAVGPSPFYTATPWSYPISAPSNGSVVGNCTATPTSKYGSATITYGYVDTKLDADGYPIPAYTVAVPTSPAPNTRIDFTIDNISPEEHGHMIFNEQILNADGSITVNAAHMYAEGPIAFGDVILGGTTCRNV